MVASSFFLSKPSELLAAVPLFAFCIVVHDHCALTVREVWEPSVNVHTSTEKKGKCHCGYTDIRYIKKSDVVHWEKGCPWMSLQ
jgi:hypothetical protein